MAGPTGRRAALGFSVHTGWAALVGVAAEAGAPPALVERRRIELVSGLDPAHPRFVFHAARERPLDEARKFVRASEERALVAAKRAVREAVEALAAAGHAVRAGAIPRPGRAAPPSLEAILASHALVHAAEGALFRDAIRGALVAADLEVVEVPPKELPARAAGALGLPPRDLPRVLARIGKAAGSPWSKDQRDAYLAACLALA